MHIFLLLTLAACTPDPGKDSIPLTDDTGQLVDADGDGYAAPEDCDDQDPARHPGAEEHCDGVDEDCDGTVDNDAVDPSTFYLDGDGDGFGDSDQAAQACSAPADHVQDATDCDDGDPGVNPGAPERCEPTGRDDDCDGLVDEDDPDLLDARTWYSDTDGDGFGDPLAPVEACQQPPGTSSNDLDCDDANAAVNPDATEVCGDGADNDCDGVSACSLEDAAVRLLGEAASDTLGKVAGVGDVDGDGRDDLLAAAPQRDGEDRDYGCVYLFSGASLASGSAAEQATAILDGEGEDDMAGYAIDGLGDVNGDGYADFVVGAPELGSGSQLKGGAYVVHGPVQGRWTLPEVAVTIDGEGFADEAGSDVALAGDANGDGVPDLLVGAWYEDEEANWAGAAYLVLGPFEQDSDLGDAHAKLTGEADHDWAGATVDGAGDVDGDGLDDLLIAAIEHDADDDGAGAGDLVLGGVAGTHSLADADARIYGAGHNATLGRALVGGGDLDGDGTPELIMSAYDYDGSFPWGMVHVLPGSSRGTLGTDGATASLRGVELSDGFGSALDLLGDLDGDGNDDLVVGADYDNGAGEDAGAAWILLGPLEGQLDVLGRGERWMGEHADDSAGRSVSHAGDLDGDGLPDLAIGAPYDDTIGSSSGAVYVLWGASL